MALPSESSDNDVVQRLTQQVRDVMDVARTEVRQGPERVIAFLGRLREEPDAAFERVTERFKTLGYTAMVWETDEGGHQILAVEGVIRPEPRRRWINLALFLATALSTMLAGLSPNVDLDSVNWYLSGLPFAAALLAILLSHEMAHYVVARRYGSPVSLPYFVPMPASILGTMGAVIVQRAPMRDRKA
ncbi:MAG: site-2 protease family protein, partial [Anaerolineae bacterium]|nr:site-2 protease family protein [Anaerolineae bacterium]